MKIESTAKVLHIYIGNSDVWHGQSLALAIVERARQEGLAGASVSHGQAGFGANSRVHTASLVDLATHLPVKVEIVDVPQRIDDFLPVLDEMVVEGLVTVFECQAIRYVKDPGS